MTNPWKPRHRTAQQRPKDRLKGAQIAPLAHGAVKCGNCDHAPGLHGGGPCMCGMDGRPIEDHASCCPEREWKRCYAPVGCDCTEYVEVNG